MKELKKRRFFPCGRNFERVKVKVSTLEIERERKRVNLPKKKKISNPRQHAFFSLVIGKKEKKKKYGDNNRVIPCHYLMRCSLSRSPAVITRIGGWRGEVGERE